jgi:hypothetical protein
MAFGPPRFNLSCNLWRRPNVVTNPPDFNFNANLSMGKRVFWQNLGSAAGVQATSELLCPKLTDIRAANAANQFLDAVEVPAGSGRFYAVTFVEDVGKGFLNEYRLALIVQLRNAIVTLTGNPWAAPGWPYPTP